MREHSNSISYIRLGSWWEIMIKFVTPAVLGLMLVLSVIDEIQKGYEGYPTAALLVFGVLMVATLLVLGIIMRSRPWHNPETVKYSGFEHDYYELEQKL